MSLGGEEAPIPGVEKDIGKLGKLKMLDLRENKIAELPASLGELPNLLVALLSYNHLKVYCPPLSGPLIW